MQAFGVLPEGWNAVDMAHARWLNETTEASAIARIATNLTSPRVVGDGPSFNLTRDTAESETRLRETSSSGSLLLDQASARRSSNRVSEGAGSIPLNDLLGAVMDEWSRAARKIDREIMRQGFALIVRKESRYHPGIHVPHVVGIGLYQLFFRVMPTKGRQYIAVWTRLSEWQCKEEKLKNGDVVEDSVVLVADEFEPKDDGTLNSKMASAAALITEVGGMEESVSYGTYWGAHPVYIPEMPRVESASQSGGTGVGAPGYANYTDMLSDRSMVDEFRRARQLDSARDTAEGSYKRHLLQLSSALDERLFDLQYAASHNDSRAREAHDCNARHASRPPFLVDYPMGAGGSVRAGPAPHLPPGLDEHKKDLARRAFMTLDVQPGMVGLEHRNHASNADLVFDSQNDMIKQRQDELKPLLADAFRHVYNIDLHDADVILTDTSKKDAKDSEDDGGEKKENLSGHSATPPAGAPAPAPSMAHRVRADLTHTPLCTPDRALKLLETHAIDHQTYRQIILEICSVSQHMAANHRVSMEQVDSWFHKGSTTAAAPKSPERGATRKRRHAKTRDNDDDDDSD